VLLSAVVFKPDPSFLAPARLNLAPVQASGGPLSKIGLRALVTSLPVEAASSLTRSLAPTAEKLSLIIHYALQLLIVDLNCAAIDATWRVREDEYARDWKVHGRF
jgi:hypothetical protein